MKIVLSIAGILAIGFAVWLVATSSIVSDIQMILVEVAFIGGLLLFGAASIINRLDHFR